MSEVLASIARHARRNPTAPALRSETNSLDYAALAHTIERTAELLTRYGARVAALLLDNCPAWAAIDLAAIRAGVVLVPLPHFFSAAQLRHALIDAGVDFILTDSPERIQCLTDDGSLASEQPRRDLIAETPLWLFKAAPAKRGDLPANCSKLTYTSGTTGAPKGVCLDQRTIDAVAHSLHERVGSECAARHLSVLPLATLLENIGGVYVPLLAGGCSQLPALASVGLGGASNLDAQRLTQALERFEATSTIFIPQMLRALCEQRARLPRLRFAAVGGAPVSRKLLAQAAALRLPVYEGYGLSECTSVVTLNTPADHRPGSVGKPLAHARLRFASDGEILVSGGVFEGYLHETPARPIDGFWPTGDIGYLDRDGYLYLTGRKKNTFITAFGRNVAPEWVERELGVQHSIAQSVVFGEGRPWNVAVIVPTTPFTTSAAINAAVKRTNENLPDYARVTAWIRADEPFNVRNDQMTGTFRPRRDAVWRCYGARIEQLYEGQSLQEHAT